MVDGHTDQARYSFIVVCISLIMISFPNVSIKFLVCFQWIDHQHWYDRKDTSTLHLQDVVREKMKIFFKLLFARIFMHKPSSLAIRKSINLVPLLQQSPNLLIYLSDCASYSGHNPFGGIAGVDELPFVSLLCLAWHGGSLVYNRMPLLPSTLFPSTWACNKHQHKMMRILVTGLQPIT